MAIISADIWQGERESRGSLKKPHFKFTRGFESQECDGGGASKSFVCRDDVSTLKYELVALAFPAI